MQILEGLRVVELSVHHQGPSTGAKLGEMGAEVIKLEPPVTGELARGLVEVYGAPTILPSGRNWFIEALNYNKKSVAIDLKSEAGKEAAYRLVEKSDIFLTNLRPHAVQRLGLDYQNLRRVNPKLIYASSSCLGTLGPFGRNAGLESIAQARSGMMSVAGDADGPPVTIMSSICDQAGSLLLTIGILAAVIARQRYGIGQEVTTSQLGSGMLLCLVNVMGAVLSGQEQIRDIRASPRNPLFNFYRCRDGRWVMMCMYEERYFEPFCRAVGHAEWTQDPRFAAREERLKNSVELTRLLVDMFEQQPYIEWEKKLLTEDLLFSVINNASDVADDPQIKANNLLPLVDHPALGKTPWMLTPIQFSETPLVFKEPAPEIGQHTEEVLVESCGYSWGDIDRLRNQHVI